MNDVSLSAVALLIARHLAGALGGYLVHKGYLEADGLTGFTGAVMTIAAVGGSWWDKRGRVLAYAELSRAYDRLSARTMTKQPADPSAPSVTSKS